MSKIRTAALVIALSASFLPAPGGAAELKLEADLGQTVLSASKPGNVYLRLSLKSLAAGKREKRTPVNAAIVIDRSGSMQGERIAAAKEGARVALKRLSSDDTVALIAYNHEVDVLSPAAPLRNSRDKLLEAIDRLHADGTTALYDGVKEGGRQVEEYVSDNNVNRVILLSDGLANVGPSSPGELAELGRKLASKGISVSTIGLGLDYNEDLMQRLAAASDGNHVFVERPSDLAEIFDREFGDALSVSARDITIIIECRAGFTPKRILGRDGSVDGNKVTLKLNQLQADNERYVVVELEAPEGRTEGAADVADVSVTYVDLDNGGKPARAEAKPSVRFSSNAKEIEDGLNKPVMSQVTQQIATENSEQAVELRDKGDIEGARKVLEENAEYIKRSRDVYASGAAPAPTASVGALTDLENKSREAAGSLGAGDWDRTRKMMRHDQHKAKVQQAY
ncbi:MAG: VWA domain-containing protein [Hyphomicrobium sp.]|uniref:vWA domain-containing protein n=1 Tax=Hyphomicrobium sp. TaxID=82 RepID=UPI0013228EF5|nr:VWA domain-containing protein [Hyphomicrobium sp.]KAB2940422.1 MAG: VWA domain-containing protein [Hyphomicrobium sp.]MBZ0208255.1 VWA domain-containing protein [Hyphomicrobium sp.]